MLWRSAKHAIAEYDQLAMLTSRLALFLTAGLSPQAAWRELAEESEQWTSHSIVSGISQAIEQGVRHRDAVSEASQNQATAWRELSAVVGTADVTGAPLASTLWSYATSMAERSRVEREIRAIAHAPRMTVWLLIGLVPLGMLVASVLGANPLGFLVGSGLGLITLSLSTVLMVLAVLWMGRLVRQATPDDDHAGVERELFAIAVSAGLLPEAARETVLAMMAENNLLASISEPSRSLAELSRRAGVPVAELARAEAAWFRDRRRTEAQELAAALSVRILLPVGLLILPAFVMVAVMPVVVSLLGQALTETTLPW